MNRSGSVMLLALANVMILVGLPLLIGWRVHAATGWTSWSLALLTSFLLGASAFKPAMRLVAAFHRVVGDRARSPTTPVAAAIAAVSFLLLCREVRTPGALATELGAHLLAITMGCVFGSLAAFFLTTFLAAARSSAERYDKAI